MRITLFSFGYKHGPAEADTVLDMRFLPNPFYVPEMKAGTGLEKRISDYVLKNRTAAEFLALLEPVLLTYIANHHKAGRASLRLAVGCTGGRHRSVAVTEYLRGVLNKSTHELMVYHRDIDKE
ncbi:MAG: RNase adapter RapZ [Desulfobulbaceae bacterium]|nr:RNase adapter RapZ [Desulfobulbaceae bacterium]